jgi:hypothetical protein
VSKLPVPIDDQGKSNPDQFGAKQSVGPAAPQLAAPFLALDRASTDTTAIGWSTPACDPARRLVSAASVVDPLLFFASGGPAAPLKTWWPYMSTTTPMAAMCIRLTLPKYRQVFCVHRHPGVGLEKSAQGQASSWRVAWQPRSQGWR